MDSGDAILISIIQAIVVACCVGTWSAYISTYTIEGTVKDKFIAPTGDGGTTYVVILTDDTKLEIQRNFWYGGTQFNEDVIFASIEKGKTYKFTCWGWVLDFWMIYWYPNVIKVEQI